MGRIHLVRHGQASLLSDDYDKLSPLGEEQARVVGRWFATLGEKIVLVAHGTLQRQQRTAAEMLAAAGSALVPHVDEGFDEYSHNDLIGRAWPALADAAALGAHIRASAEPRREFQSLFEQALQRWLAGTLPGSGMSWPAFRARGVAALERIAAQCGAGESAVVVSSGGVIAAIVQSLLGLPDEQVDRLHMPLYNASITTLMTRPGGAIALSGFNAIGHLQSASASLVTYR